ncbi:sensor domain-containing protein [Litoribacillus peritrichatus]|uniref:EAL domain-containing protein n=1 Tax=Litoribacillus peritrichatus TaxID=718191 RepID=A0ABP7N030_9GAMM
MKDKQVFTRLVECSPGGIFYTDSDGACTFISSSMYDMFGLEPENCLGENWTEYINSSSGGSVQSNWLKALNAQETFEQEFFHVSPQLGKRTFRAKLKPIYEGSDFMGYVGSVVDVTDRYEAEHHLFETEARFKKLFDFAEVAIWDENFTGVYSELDLLRKSGVHNLAEYLDKSPELILSLAQKIHVNHVNIRGLELFNAETEDDLLSRIDTTFTESSAKVFRDELIAIWNGEESFRAEVDFRALDGELITTILSMPLPKSISDALSVPVSIFDITERAQLINELTNTVALLQESEERFSLAVKGSGVGLWDWNLLTGDVYYSDKFKEILGYQPEEFPNTQEAFWSAVHEADVDAVRQAVAAHIEDCSVPYDMEYRIKSRRGEYCWVKVIGQAVRSQDGKARRIAGSMIDITDQKLAEHLIWQQANYDNLTALPNRAMFLDRFEQEVVRGKRSGDACALLFIDLDHFKEVNDTLGHNVGDQLLVEAAMRILMVIRESDTVGRFGGDEFIVMLTNIADPSSVERVATAIVDTLSKPFNLNDEVVFISASIGIAMSPNDSVHVDELFKFADQAMYEAKTQGRNRHSFFTASMQESATRQRKLIKDLRGALEQEQLEVYYQPIIDLKSEEIYKAEALIRWHHPEYGFVSPVEFIPLAEETGLIIEIGEWVFQQAVNQVKEWRRLINPDFQLSVNKSPVQFHQETPSNWAESLSRSGLSGNAITIEITEGLLLESDQSVKDQIESFHVAGIQVALDDFGTGYSSLSYLKKFDIDCLKIDQAFVRNMEEGSEEHILCEAIIVMAHKLGIKVVAEGIETEQQKVLLVSAGCDYGQGYYFAKPVEAKMLTAQLIKEKRCA